MKEFLVALLGQTLQATPDAVAALFNADESLKDDALATVKQLHADHIKVIRDRDGKTFDNGYKKGQLETATRKEKAIATALGIETDLTGDEFNDEVVRFVGEKASKGKEITDDVVKLHPVFIAREKTLLKELKDAKDSAAAEVEKVTKETERKEVLSKIHAKAVKAIKDKALLPADEEKAMKQLKRLLLDPLGVYDYKLDADGNVTEITKDGARLEDGNGNARSFDELIISTATENGIDFKTADNKNSANGDGNNSAGTGKKPIVLPKTEQEYAAYVSDSKIPVEDRTAMQEAWKAKAAQTV